jgi:hypothetical protein
MAEEKITNNTITIDGRKLLVNSLVNGVGIQFTHFGIGDGEAPTAPENLAVLVNELFTVPVSKTQASDTEKGVTLVRGGFTNSNEKGDFYWRELGVYARKAGSEETPVLFGYVNYGDAANYIPSVGVQSIIEQGIIMQIVTGSATVVYLSDPTAKATLQDLDECVQQVEERLEEFTQEHLDSIAQQVKTLQTSISDATEQLTQATEGFVLKAGDTMEGDLDMGEHKVIGSLSGSASMWNGWSAFDSLNELNVFSGTNLTADSTVLEIINAMPAKARFIRISDASSPFSVNGQLVHGMIEIFKPDGNFAELLISGTSGLRYRCAWETTAGLTPWVSDVGIPAGVISTYAGAAAPLGYLLCHGQSVSTTTYAALFAAIGHTYGGSGTSFKLPDLRGVFLRGLDAGRGIDSGRKLGTQQQSGAPNITGRAGTFEHWAGVQVSEGALISEYHSNRQIGGGGGGAHNCVRIDASRSSSVYQNGLNEVRPVNVAINYIIKY